MAIQASQILSNHQILDAKTGTQPFGPPRLTSRWATLTTSSSSRRNFGRALHLRSRSSSFRLVAAPFSLCLSLSICLDLFVSVSVSLSLFLCLSFLLSRSLSVSLSVSLCLCLSLGVYICFSVSFSLSVSLSWRNFGVWRNPTAQRMVDENPDP